MEELLKLLNEYDSGWAYDDYYGLFQYGQDRDAYRLCKYQLVSKEYGFIKWLVDNDKIDFEKIEEKTKCKNIVGGEEFSDFDIEKDFTPYEEVLMWLSIQDEPIEFLISILK